MSVRFCLLLAAVLAPLVACDSAGLESAPFEPALAADPWPEMLSAVNDVRARGARCGDRAFAPAGPLVWNDRLGEAALQHTLDMRAHHHFAHTGTDGSAPGDRARRAGYAWRVVGENIARYQPTLDEVISDWMASPSHCRQIMDPAYVEMGAAEHDRYWTQMFGLPR